MAGTGATEAALLKIGVAFIQRAAPSGIAIIKSWLKGKEVLIVGQARAGKTTFIEYLQYGLFEGEKETAKTKDKAFSPRFNVKMGRDSALELNVKTVVDIPGQWGPMAHADLVFDRRPHAVIVVTDLTTPLRRQAERASGEWLREFCKHLELKWRAKGRSTNRIKSMIVLMNKFDKSNERSAETRRREFRKILDAELREARGQMMDEIAIMPCTLVTNSLETRLVDGVIAHLAKSLVK